MMNYFSKSREIILLIALIVFLVALFAGMLPEGPKKNNAKNIITKQHEEKRINQSIRPGKRDRSLKNSHSTLRSGDFITQRGFLFLILGGLIGKFAWLWFLVKGFKQSFTWGILILFLPYFGALYFARSYWYETKIPIFLYSIGFFMFWASFLSMQ
jgi:hypothetical protein